MKAIVRDRFGSADVLSLRSVDKPSVRTGEILVDVHAAGVDPGVWIFMTGYPLAVRSAIGLRRPRAPGLGRAVSGVVAEVGPGVTRLHPGDEVYGTTTTGAYAEFAVARADRLARKPGALTFAQAAAVPISAVTAAQAMRDAGVRTGQRVLITGAGGGVGTYAVQMAHARGATVTAVCGSAKLDLVRSLGVAETIDYTKEEIDAPGTRWDVIVDTAGNRPLPLLRRVLAGNGVIALVGGGHAQGRILGGFQRQMAAPLISRFGPGTVKGVAAHERYEDLDELTDLIESGRLKPVIDRAYPLAETPDAIRHLALGHPTGKIVVTVRD